MALASSLPNREQIAAGLKKAPLFAGLENRQIERLAQHAVPHGAKPDELLFVEGDGCQGLYVVFSGAVKIFKQSTQGREQVLTVERAGAVVAELPVFDGGPYPASCKAVEPSILLFISKQDFRQSCQDDPEVALKVLASVGGRLRRLVMIIEELSFLTVRSRLATLLLELARTQASVAAKAETSKRGGPSAARGAAQAGKPAALRVPINMTHQEIASRIGTVRELVSRNLGRLEAEGIIRLDGRAFVIEDWARLEQEALAEE
ncbi:MAG: Crp/Fnr family transcriptional regulator [Acidobacteria bacterium]|nr:Crp/Fnr family transcriptional regulator [Acidobacteriota bacterium]